MSILETHFCFGHPARHEHTIAYVSSVSWFSSMLPKSHFVWTELFELWMAYNVSLLIFKVGVMILKTC